MGGGRVVGEFGDDEICRGWLDEGNLIDGFLEGAPGGAVFGAEAEGGDAGLVEDESG